MSSEDRSLKSVDDVLTEEETLNLLGIKRSVLDQLRYDSKLPFYKITKFSRLYRLRDVLDYIEGTWVRMNVGN